MSRMMSRRVPPLEDAYFTWLYSHVEPIRLDSPAVRHVKLFHILHATPFVDLIPNDENRAADGIDLRVVFLEDDDAYSASADWMSLECSMLEMFIALCNRAYFETDHSADPGGVRGWFWIIMTNLGLAKFTDEEFAVLGDDTAAEAIRHILRVMNHRLYSSSGYGGAFPLLKPRRDQRKIELWYQLAAYLIENRYVNVS